MAAITPAALLVRRSGNFFTFSCTENAVLLRFSDFESSSLGDSPAVSQALGIGFCFDLRLALLLMLPVALLAWLLTTSLAWFALWCLERPTLERTARPLNTWPVTWGSAQLIYNQRATNVS